MAFHISFVMTSFSEIDCSKLTPKSSSATVIQTFIDTVAQDLYLFQHSVLQLAIVKVKYHTYLIF